MLSSINPKCRSNVEGAIRGRVELPFGKQARCGKEAAHKIQKQNLFQSLRRGFDNSHCSISGASAARLRKRVQEPGHRWIKVGHRLCVRCDGGGNSLSCSPQELLDVLTIRLTAHPVAPEMRQHSPGMPCQIFEGMQNPRSAGSCWSAREPAQRVAMRCAAAAHGARNPGRPQAWSKPRRGVNEQEPFSII